MKTGSWVFLVLFFVVACGDRSSESALSKAQLKLKSTSSISYDYSTVWDNRFNESEFKNGASVRYIDLPEGDHGFGLLVSADSWDYYYDGRVIQDIDHDEKMIVVTPREDIATDSSYFEGFIFFMTNPMQLNEIDVDALEFVEDEVYSFYTSRDTSMSVIDETKTVINIVVYQINNASLDVESIQSTTIIEGDTAQIIDHFFSNYDYSYESVDLARAIRPDYLSYVTVNDEDVVNEMAEKQIQVSDKLTRSIYPDLRGEEVDLTQDTTVLMFSFIGCGGCEHAMKEMRSRSYNFREDLQFYYASPVDKETLLEEYLDNKEYEGRAFGKGSLINEEFGAWSFPTFFVIAPGGEVLRIFHGYSSELETYLF